MKVKEIMTRNPVSLMLPNSRNSVIKLLVSESLTGVPVINEKTGGYMGMITRQHLFDNPKEDQLALLVDEEYPVLTPDQSINTAAKFFVEQDVHHIPVIKDGDLKGIVTPADLLKTLINKKDKRDVFDFMCTPCIPVHVSTPLVVATEVVRLAKVYAMPVLDDEGKLVGIVTDRDLFNLSEIKNTLESSNLGLGDDEDQWTWEGLRNVMTLYYETSLIKMPNINVEKVMIKDPKTVFAKTSVSNAAEIMVEKDFGQLPVTDVKDKLVGMVFELDLVKALVEGE